MDEITNLAMRDRRTNAALDVIPTHAQFSPWEGPAREPHLLDYVMVLRKYQWSIVFFMLTVVTFVTIATLRMQPVYEATARVEIDNENTNFLPFKTDSYEMYVDMENYIETQSKILQSETLALQTIKSVNLADLPEYGGQPGKTAKALPSSGTLANQERPAALGPFIGRLHVKRVPNSRLLDLTFESNDPRLAARVANAHLENFIEQNFRSKYEATATASNWLASQLNELKIKVEKSEDARITYERQKQIWTIDEKQNITTQKLSDLNRELTTSQGERVRAEATYQLVRAGNIEALPAVRENSVLQDLLKKQTDLNAQYTDALNQYGPNFPKVVRLQAQLKELEQVVSREKTNIVNQIEAVYRTARQRELLLSQALDKQKAETNAMAERLVQYNILKRDAEANKQLYEGLLQKLKEAGITAGLRSSNIRVVDPALVPAGPTRPQRGRNIMLGFLIGLVGGVGLALLREYLDNTVKTPDDIESLTRLPSLAVVPAFVTLNGRGRTPRMLRSQSGNGAETRVELVSHNLPQSQVSEAFRALRTSLLLSQAEHPPQVILVTSALPREGKTTAAVNLAVTLAQLGDRTLLMDADLRKPGISRALSMHDGKYAGLSSYLAGVSSLELVTVPHPAITNLAAIPTGPVPPNPADLLSSRRLSEAIRELRQEYKFIVIDSPPIMAATDGVILSVLADGVLLVVRSGETPKDAFTRARDQLGAVKCRLLGVVLNAVDASSPDYYYSYRYYPYSYGHAYGREKSSAVEKQQET